MRQYYQLLLIVVFLVSCTVNSQSVVATSSWRPVGSGITFGISGMALVNQDNNQSNFLIVHDNKKTGENRLAIVGVAASNQNNQSIEYLPLVWPNNVDLPIDLEAITRVTGTDKVAFMAASSQGRIYYFTLENNQTISILKVLDLPEISQGSNFEGVAIQEIDGKLVIVWGHRGQDSDPGVIYWGTLDLNSYQISPQGSAKFTVPWPREKVRHISDIKIDSAGTLYVTAATDNGDEGPFSSAVYVAGVFTVNQSKVQFRVNSELAALYRFDGYKIEGLELIPGENGGVIFGTDDENMGSSIYTSF
ncbi:hypothetical protein [Planktothricoides raciborskii]|uniref:Uncharacterized protein n=1 Tax=Planktothricoides raciborskii GIHE-MW2 TaxID=2792601 RepID=A0AAU8JHM2_9CYAN